MSLTAGPAFVLIGGRPALDLVATFGRRHAEGLERIPDADALARWFVAAGLLPGVPVVTEADLDAARRLRAAITVLVDAALVDGPADPAAVETVNEWAQRPDLPPRLGCDADGRLRAVAVDGSATAALAGIARDAVRLLGGASARRIKECEHPDCSLVFVDETQSARRRWCSMERCGNLVKTAGYRARRAR
jgi:predicted RNA-binding Zn ribbon-like protein